MTFDLFKFWMVYGIGQGVPTHRHKSKESAQAEAQRLARAHPGRTFVVLSAKDAYRANEPVVALVKLMKTADGERFDSGIRTPRSHFHSDDIPF